MQAIQTTWHGPTDTRGSRITARAEAGSVTVPWDYALGVEENHKRAAERLITKLGWHTEHYGQPVGGSLPGGRGYAFVLVK